MEARTKERETETHLKTLAEHEARRVVAEIHALDAAIASAKERSNQLQNDIFIENENVQTLRMDMKMGTDEMKQWAIVEREKEEDSDALSKYTKQDQKKYAELVANQQKETANILEAEKALYRETTQAHETKIILEKTTEDFRNIHKERQDCIQKVEEITSNVRLRDEEINRQNDRLTAIQVEIAKQIENMELKNKHLLQQISNNDRLEKKIDLDSRELATLKCGTTFFLVLIGIETKRKTSRHKSTSFVMTSTALATP